MRLNIFYWISKMYKLPDKESQVLKFISIPGNKQIHIVENKLYYEGEGESIPLSVINEINTSDYSLYKSILDMIPQDEIPHHSEISSEEGFDTVLASNCSFVYRIYFEAEE